MSKGSFDFSFKTFLLLLKEIAKIITYPVRKPLVGIPIILILFLLPTFNGVKPGEVPNWYWQKLNPVKRVVTNFGDAVEKHSKPVTNQFGTIVKGTSNALGINQGYDTDKDPNILGLAQPNDTSEEPVEFGETRRKSFGEGRAISDYELDGEEEVDTSDYFDNGDEEYYEEEELEGDFVEVEEDKNQMGDEFGLTYLDKKINIIGTPKVLNANQLSIDGKTIILHGIYTDPDSRLGRRAAIYLVKFINESDVICEIQAYTTDGIATAICYADDVNINELLVNDGFSEQIFKS